MNVQDIVFILRWFLVFVVIGFAFLPFTLNLFKEFKDKGYIFSKIIGIAVISYTSLLLGTLHLVKFSEISLYLILITFLIINYAYSYYKKENILSIIKKNLRVFLLEELIFLIGLFFWSYIRSNFPEIHGLEKYMDFGFVNSILRSDYFPAKDMWYTPLSINYYYFGHLVTAILTKLSFIPSLITYNLMLATLFGFTFTAASSLVINLFDLKKYSIKSIVAGLISAIFISMGGNLTTIYTFFKAYPNDHAVPFWQQPFLPFTFPNGYWYPNATRFIPFTIHEFPIYSFVVSDLHGHVLDIPFVLLSLATIYVFLIKPKINIYHLVFFSFLLAVMYMTNAWDGLIYMLLGFIFIFILNFYKSSKKWTFSKSDFYKSLVGFSTLIIGFFTFSLPFSAHFKPFVSGIGILCAPTFLTKIGKLGPFLFEADHCQKSPIWQIVILYGAFYFFVISFLFFLKFKKKYEISKNDIFILILFILSTFLIIIPEFIYVKDIYPTYYRANTMFKLTYEAFMMLSLACGYIVIRLISEIKRKLLLIPFLVTSFMLISMVFIYPIFAINSYYRDLKTYESLDGTKYLSSLYPGDYNLINFINKNIKGQPIILEAAGDSYTDYARISTNTGLPTVVGWPVHEWLWRGTYDIVGPRVTDTETLYTTTDVNTFKQLLNKYNISYVVVSSLETKKYPKLNEILFMKFGKVIYQSGVTKLYKISSSKGN